MLPVVSSIVSLLMNLSPIAVEFSSSFQLLSRDFSFRYNSGEDGRWNREKEGEEAGKHVLLIKLRACAGMTEWASTPLSTCLSDP
jgi:hypothetical protein